VTVAIRTLRRSRQLTLTDLALLTGIPARTIAEFEHGLRHLDDETATLLASVFGLAPAAIIQRLTEGHRAPQRGRQQIAMLAAGSLVAATLVAPIATARLSALFAAPAPAPVAARFVPTTPPLPTTAPRATALPTAAAGVAAQLNEAAAPASSAGLALGRVAQMTAVPAAPPAFVLRADGPHGCPIPPIAGVVITQGYGVGTHAPARIWGAVDLALDGDGDGFPEPGTTTGAPVLATHDGTARIYPGTWPGGNVVMVEAAGAGWVTLYAHLASFAVTDRQPVTAGTVIGTIGNTGQSSGPHLHYEVRGIGGNLDPAPLLGCGTPIPG
jgi:murein DD-endopeptidase MepM/ murein hydrolase activator NlpD